MDEIRIINDIPTRIKLKADSLSNPVILLLHGFTGDENSMWVFTQKLPNNATIIAPRGIYSTRFGGYSWLPDSSGSFAWIDEYQLAIDTLLEIISPRNFSTIDIEKFYIAGFSQGAALTYALALTHPNRMRGLAGLAGFMPQGAEAFARNIPLKGIPAFVAHGTLDEVIPIDLARKAVEVLKASGAEVSYCEDQVNHKMSAACFKDFAAFFDFNRRP
jgi:phospholipase/carboxylesterase